uniref:Uncharacterized protein n=1 Tax=Oryza sativa subsp. japonica TaxID=39947 RepID=Q2R141_ORYSJ|nr:hypothetical protein LOC_Os11g40439 [Oryza sativa Japonica Group]
MYGISRYRLKPSGVVPGIYRGGAELFGRDGLLLYNLRYVIDMKFD